MEILDGSEPFLQWDRNLSELSCDNEDVLYNTHFTDLLDDLSQEALLGQLLSDPFLSGRGEAMDTEAELTLASPVPPHIQTEHSYSLSGDSRPQSPLSNLNAEAASETGDTDAEDWSTEPEENCLKMEPLLSNPSTLLPTLVLTLAPERLTAKPESTASGPAFRVTLPQVTQIKDDSENFSPKIKLEPHEVDQFLNLSPKELESLQMPPTPPSSHGSDTEGSQSPVHPCAPAGSPNSPAALKVASRAPIALSNSPLLTAPHKLQGSGPLLLTEEERRTLIAEGYTVPTKLPLTKSEEKALKKIRRKIKNKISAQESRRKKKEYMDALEKKVETCSNENSELRQKVENLECTNKSLLQQLHSLQAVVAGKVPRSCRMASTQTSTCLMVVVLCFGVFLGNFYQGPSPCSTITKTDLSRKLTLQESYTATVKSRNLLGYEELVGAGEPHPSGLGGDYPELDSQDNIIATWHQDQKRSHQQAEPRAVEPHPPFIQNNQTNVQKSILVELHPHSTSYRAVEARSSGCPKVIGLERTVNEPS